MRTTVRLDEKLLREVKVYAAERGETLTAILDRALRELLARRSREEAEEPAELPSFAGRGLQPGVDLDDAAALIELMETDADPG